MRRPGVPERGGSLRPGRKLLWGAALAALALEAAAAAPEPPAAAAFQRLTELVGRWQGTYAWSGTRTGNGPIAAHYYLTGNGSAVVEDLEMGSTVVMTSVYHLDGRDLRMTHFCAAGNQPRLKARPVDAGGARLTFELVDVTNLPAPDSPHVEALELRIEDDRLVLLFTFLAGGKPSYERIELTRDLPPPD